MLERLRALPIACLLPLLMATACGSEGAASPAGTGTSGAPGTPDATTGVEKDDGGSGLDASTTEPRVAPSVQCSGACPTSRWARATTDGVPQPRGSRAASVNGTTYVIVSAHAATAVLGAAAGEKATLERDEAAILALDDQGQLKKRIAFTNADTISALAAAADGRLALIVRRAAGTADLTIDGAPITGAQPSRSTLLVLDAQGAPAWTADVAGGLDSASLAFGSDGSVFLGATQPNGLSGTTASVRKWSAAGVAAWTKGIAGVSNSSENVSGLAVAQGGELFVTGFHSGALMADVPVPAAPSAFLLKMAASDGSFVWGMNVSGASARPSLVVLGTDPVVIDRTSSRFAGAGNVAPATATWQLALPEGVGVNAASTDGTRITVLGSLGGPTKFPFGTLGDKTSSVSNAAGGLFVVDVSPAGKLEGGFAINPSSGNGASWMLADNLTTSGARIVVAGIYSPTIDLGFGAFTATGGRGGEFVVGLERP